jgi:Immunity protein Imm1
MRLSISQWAHGVASLLAQTPCIVQRDACIRERLPIVAGRYRDHGTRRERSAVRFTLYWGMDDSARINNVDDLDLQLTLLTRGRRRARTPYAVDLLPAGAHDGGLQFGVGHPERAFVLALDPPGGYAVEPGVAPWPEAIAFDYGHELVELKAEWTRVTAQAAIEAARHYVRTGTRPAMLTFDRIAVPAPR